MQDKYTLKIFETADVLYKVACDFIIDASRKAIAARGRFTIALSGGNTPKELYAHLAQPEFRDQIDWKNIFVFWGDERCVPSNDERNNAHLAKIFLLDKVEIPASNIFPIPVDVSPADAALAYEKTIVDFFGKRPAFDLILLGLGENGHTASLFPMTDVLHEKVRYVKEVFVEEQDMYRITMTAPLINQSHQILFLVTGNNKADVLKEILKGPYQPDLYPAQLIQQENGNLHWFVDREAGELV